MTIGGVLMELNVQKIQVISDDILLAIISSPNVILCLN